MLFWPTVARSGQLDAALDELFLASQVKLASFKEEQLPYRSCAAIHVGAAVLARVARSRRSEPLLDERSLKLRSSRAESNWQLRATVGLNSSSVQMASACQVCSVLVYLARSGRLDADLDERSLKLRSSMTSSNRPLRATVGQNSSSIQIRVSTNSKKSEK